jgi:hypothetical protein
LTLGLFAFDPFEDRVAVVVDDHVEDKRAATHWAVLDEVLAPAGGRVDADGVLLGARRTRIEHVLFERHGYGASARAVTIPPNAPAIPKTTLPIV